MILLDFERRSSFAIHQGREPSIFQGNFCKKEIPTSLGKVCHSPRRQPYIHLLLCLRNRVHVNHPCAISHAIFRYRGDVVGQRMHAFASSK